MSDLPQALNQRGLAFLAAKDYGRAIKFFQAAITEDPTLADAFTNLGVAQFMSFAFDGAKDTLQHSLSLRPNHPETLLNLGYVLWRLNDNIGAISTLQQAIAIKDDLGLAHIALGSVFWEIGISALAIHHCRRGLETEPDAMLGYDTLREVFHYDGREAEGYAICDEMIRRWPQQRTHEHKKAMMMLTFRNPEGWPAHECRYDGIEGITQIARDDPVWFSRLYGNKWEGQHSRHLLVVTEQGYGDVIQFLRYLPLAAARCDKLTLHIPESLRKLVAESFNIPHMVIDPEMPDDFAHWCLILSLPHMMGDTEHIPAPPYLVASQHRYDEVRRLPGPRVGIVWEGNKTMPDDRWRSMPFETMARLFDLPASFVSLQFPCTIDLRPYPITVVHPVKIMFSGNLDIDWTETAALLATLDLVIGVDTAVVHLAGAMGKPVWLCNRYNTDWRWGLQRSDSPWYPSMRIYRQSRMGLGKWDEVIDQVIADLKRELLEFAA
jgi:tetratricopeptide (TPR) repeat protein